MRLKGAYTALITPFKGEELDEEGLAFLVERQVKAGIEGLILLGSTGEAATLNEEEKKRVVQIAVQKAKRKVPLVVGCGHNSTRETILQIKKATDWGADCALVVNPYYNKPTQEGIFAHYEAISAACSLPLMLYNVPSRTASPIQEKTMRALAALPHMVAVKESSGDVAYCSAVIPYLPLFSGDDILTLPLMSLGAVGIVSTLANLLPEKIVSLVSKAAQGDFTEAQKIHYDLAPLFKMAFIETNPVPIKTMMRLFHLPAGQTRLPLCPLLAEHQKQLEAALEPYASCV